MAKTFLRHSTRAHNQAVRPLAIRLQALDKRTVQRKKIPDIGNVHCNFPANVRASRSASFSGSPAIPAIHDPFANTNTGRPLSSPKYAPKWAISLAPVSVLFQSG